MSTKITPGTYRLTKDLPALSPDRRKRHDWRAAATPSGTEMIVTDERHRATPDGDGPEHLEVYPRGAWSHQSVPVADLPADCLERLDETPSQWLRRDHSINLAAKLLDLLVADGTLTLAQIQDLARRLDG